MSNANKDKDDRWLKSDKACVPHRTAASHRWMPISNVLLHLKVDKAFRTKKEALVKTANWLRKPAAKAGKTFPMKIEAFRGIGTLPQRLDAKAAKLVIPVRRTLFPVYDRFQFGVRCSGARELAQEYLTS